MKDLINHHFKATNDMEKPNITGTKWNVNDKGVVFNWGNGPETKNYYPCIAKVSIWVDNPKSGIANAKAISAVPEMIDALIEAREDLIDEYILNGDDTPEYRIKYIDNALKKAGCTEN